MIQALSQRILLCSNNMKATAVSNAGKRVPSNVNFSGVLMCGSVRYLRSSR